MNFESFVFKLIFGGFSMSAHSAPVGSPPRSPTHAAAPAPAATFATDSKQRGTPSRRGGGGGGGGASPLASQTASVTNRTAAAAANTRRFTSPGPGFDPSIPSFTDKERAALKARFSKPTAVSAAAHSANTALKAAGGAAARTVPADTDDAEATVDSVNDAIGEGALTVATPGARGARRTQREFTAEDLERAKQLHVDELRSTISSAAVMTRPSYSDSTATKEHLMDPAVGKIATSVNGMFTRIMDTVGEIQENVQNGFEYLMPATGKPSDANAGNLHEKVDALDDYALQLLGRSEDDRKTDTTRHDALLGRFTAIDARDTELQETRASRARWRCCAITTMLTSVVAVSIITLWNAPKLAYNTACNMAFQVCKLGDNQISHLLDAEPCSAATLPGSPAGQFGQ